MQDPTLPHSTDITFGIIEITGIILLSIFITLTQFVGMGGGPVITICLHMFFSLDTKSSVKYTYLVLFGGSIASTIINLPKKNQQGFPLINYELVMMTLPTIVAGSVIGVYFNNILPQICIILLMIAFLSFISYKTYNKIQKEKSRNNNTTIIQQIREVDMIVSNHQNHKLLKLLQEQRDPLPWNKLKHIFYVIIVTVFLFLIRGSSSVHSILNFTECGLGYWIVNILIIAIIYLFNKSFVIILTDRKNQLMDNGYHPKDIGITLQKSALAGVAAGCLGTTMGMGGGLILVPLWVGYNIDPQVCASSSSFLIIWNSLIAIIQISLQGFYQLDMTILLLLISLLCPSLGIRILSKIMGEGGIGMLYIILIVMVLSLAVLSLQSLITIINGQVNLFEWGNLCGV